jgi:ligand-binding sensor domain-containing protein
LLFVTSIISAQKSIQIKTLTTEDGLNFRHVNGIAQDQKGFMWFATNQGITKYDGNTFITFDSKKDNPNFIPYEQVSEIIYQAYNNTMWFVADYKLFELNLDDDSLVEMDDPDLILDGEIIDIALDKNNNLWIVKDNSKNYKSRKQDLIKYDRNAFKLIKSIERKSAGFTSIDVTNSNTICWSTINQGVTILSQQGQVLNHKKIDTYDWYGYTIHYGKSFFSSDDVHYYFNEGIGGVDVYKDLEFMYRLVDSKSKIDFGVENSLGGIWFTGEKTLFYVNSSKEVFDYSEYIQEALDFSNINYAYLDVSDLLWLGTDNGLIKVRLQPQNFKKILNIEDKGWGRTFRDIFPLKNGSIGAMSESDNQIYKIDKNGQTSQIKLPNAKNYLKDARFFVSDTNSNKAYTVTNYLLEIDFNTNSIKRHNTFSPYLNETRPNPIIQLHDKSLLSGYTLSKLIRIDPEKKTLKRVLVKDNSDDFIVKALLQSKQDPEIVWVGTIGHGLFKLNLNGKIEARYDVNSKPSLGKNHIMALCEFGNKLLVGTFGGGISIIDMDQNIVSIIDKKEGLADNNVVSVLARNKDEILAATYNGLSRINLTTGDVQNYFEKDGISNNEFNYSSSYKTAGGTYYFGGMNGITKFSLDNLSKKKVLPALNFTQLEYFNQQSDTLIQATKLEGKPVVLSPYDINLKVDWSVPDYFNKENYNYYTIMEGFENNWFYQGNNSSIRYNQLPAGEYTFKVRGMDINGNKSKAGIEIPIVVNQIFYKTWWFILLIVISIAAIGYSFFQYRLQQALALERLRTKISSDLHDDVGSMLTGLAMQTEMLEMQATSKAEKNKFKRLTMLSRNTISHMRDFVWSIDSRKDRLEDLVERMHEYAEECLLPAGITYEIQIKGTPFSKKIDLNCRRNLFLIYKEAVTNILKHSNARHVDVSIFNQNTSCKFRIKDDGDIKNIKNTTGQGLANMKMRSSHINAELSFDLTDGFCIEILMPRKL